MALSSDILRKVLDLGFYTEVLEQRAGNQAAPAIAHLRTRKIRTGADWAWEIACWLLMAIGIFTRQAMVLGSHVDFDMTRFSIRIFLASLVLALAVFAPFMKWLNKKSARRGLLKIALPFGFGFFAGSTTNGLAYAGKFFFT